MSSSGPTSGSGCSVLVTLDGVVHDPDRPLLFGDDLAAVRGDGVFETLLVRGGGYAWWSRICAGWPIPRR